LSKPVSRPARTSPARRSVRERLRLPKTGLPGTRSKARPNLSRFEPELVGICASGRSSSVSSCLTHLPGILRRLPRRTRHEKTSPAGSAPDGARRRRARPDGRLFARWLKGRRFHVLVADPAGAPAGFAKGSLDDAAGADVVVVAASLSRAARFFPTSSRGIRKASSSTSLPSRRRSFRRSRRPSGAASPSPRSIRCSAPMSRRSAGTT